MKRNKSKSSLRLKYLMVFPVLIGLTIFTACNNDTDVVAKSTKLEEPSNLKITKEVNEKGEDQTVIVLPPNLNKSGARELSGLMSKMKENNETVKLKPSPDSRNTEVKVRVSDNPSIYERAEQMPRFPGCEDLAQDLREDCSRNKMLKYLYNNLKYPAADKAAKIQGMAVVRFVVTETGKIEEVTVVRNPGGTLGDEAKNIVESMNHMSEKWIPGMQSGRNVSVRYTLPIRFKLEDK